MYFHIYNRYKNAKKCAQQWGERGRMAAYERLDAVFTFIFETQYINMFAVSPDEETDEEIRKKRYGEVFVETGILWPRQWMYVKMDERRCRVEFRNSFGLAVLEKEQLRTTCWV